MRTNKIPLSLFLFLALIAALHWVAGMYEEVRLVMRPPR